MSNMKTNKRFQKKAPDISGAKKPHQVLLVLYADHEVTVEIFTNFSAPVIEIPHRLGGTAS